MTNDAVAALLRQDSGLELKSLEITPEKTGSKGALNVKGLGSDAILTAKWSRGGADGTNLLAIICCNGGDFTANNGRPVEFTLTGHALADLRNFLAAVHQVVAP